ncbi:MAG: hypothetical protein RIB60_02135 [Phycisphaerales bacterium]
MLASGCAKPTADERAIDALASALSAAVLASDGDGYLAGVDPTDPYFAHESRYLANAIKKDAAPEFELKRRGRAYYDGDALVAPVRAKWQPSEKGSPRSTAFDARFTRGPDGAWRYAGAQWQTTVSSDPRIRVYATPDLAVEAELVRSAYARVVPPVEAFFGTAMPDLPPVKIYRDLAHLQLSITPTYDPPLGGWYEPGESIKMLWRPRRNAESIERVIAHELGHAMYEFIGAGADATPWWAHEGVAECSASSVHPRLDRVNERLGKLKGEGKLVEFEFLAVFDDDTFMEQRLAYPMGHSMVAYVLDTYGRERGFAWLIDLDDVGVDAASREHLGLAFADLDEAWRGTLQVPEPDADEPDA